MSDWLLDDGEKRRVARYANRIPFVTWDRFVSFMIDDDKFIEMYGWIEREDEHSDFVVLQWYWFDRREYPHFVTSSAKHSQEISDLLYHDQEWYESEVHKDCERIEDHFTGYLNWVVRLPA